MTIEMEIKSKELRIAETQREIDEYQGKLRSLEYKLSIHRAQLRELSLIGDKNRKGSHEH